MNLRARLESQIPPLYLQRLRELSRLAGRMGLEKYGDMVKKTFAIIDAVIAADNLTSNTTYDEVVDITPAAIIEFGPVPDPDGNQYTGCRLQFVITEFVN